MQELKFDRLSSENVRLVRGLSQNWVYDIIQDQYGYIWFGTWDGLNKYDGYNFTSYNVADGLSDHTIYSIVEGRDGNLWIGTDKGLTKFIRDEKLFLPVELQQSDTVSAYFNRVNYVLQAADGCIWIGTGSGLKKIDPDTDSIVSYMATFQEYRSPRSNYILHLFEDDKGMLWVSTTFGLVRFDPQNERSTRYYSVPGDSTGLSNDNIRCVMQESSGNFWIGTRNGLNYYDTTTQKIRQFFHDPNDPGSIGGNWIRVVYEDRAGNLWIGTDDGGLNLYDRNNDRFIRFKNKLNNDQSLSNNKVYSIFEDAAGNLWVGTYKGVNKINRYSKNFRLVRQETSGLNSDFIWDFFEDEDNKLWIATGNGINILDRNDGTYSYIKAVPGKTGSLNGNEIRTMAYVPEKNALWIGIYGTGLDKLDLKTGQVRHFIPASDKNSISDYYISDLLYAPDGKLWIATSRGLNCYDTENNVFEWFSHDPEDDLSISNDVVITLFKDSKDNLWVGTDNGLNRYDVEKNQFKRYFSGPENPIKANSFFYITEDREGTLWLGTSGNGLIRFEPSTERFQLFTTENGLPNNIIYSILQDDEGNLWMSTNRGLVRFFVERGQFITYDVKDGIQSYEFNLGSAYKGNNNVLYFGGMNGYNIVKPGEIKTNPNKPEIVITAFRKFNDLQPLEVKNEDTIRLAYDDNFFSFEVAALDYTNPANNSYQYYLEGFDKTWTVTDASNRVAEYKKVGPGNYTFYAMGSNNDGVWNTDGISVVVIITPPWYATWWFRILGALVLITVLWGLIYRRIKQIRLKHEVEKRMLDIEKQKFELEQKALRLQMNPHFIFNSLNSIQSYIVTHDTELAVTYLGKFSQLMRLILANSGNNFITFKEELKAIKHYLDLEKLRFDNKFEYSIHLDPKIDPEFIEIPPMIIQPYIENAIIHGILHKPSKGHIDIRFSLNGNALVSIVTDDGVGREKAAEIREKTGIKRKSSGMYITKARLDMMHFENNEQFSVQVTDLKDDLGHPSGTRVEVIIPYNED
jgi:ligand-binding sensor domain-containing protein